MTEFPFLFEDDAPDSEALEKVSTDTTKALAGHVRNAMALQNKIEAAQAMLSELQEWHRNVLTKDIPSLMSEMGIDSVKVDGCKVTVAPVVSASITKERLDAALDWLRASGHDDIIKNEVSLSFGKGEDGVAEQAVSALRQLGFAPTQKAGVHPSTLKAFVRQALENAVPLDMDLLGVYVVNTARIERAK